MSTEEPAPDRPPLFLVRGDASAEEVAALTAVLQGLATAAAADGEAAPRPTPEWSSHHRKLRRPVYAGPGGWRSSGQPH